jgi:hypothetical protein
MLGQTDLWSGRDREGNIMLGQSDIWSDPA